MQEPKEWITKGVSYAEKIKKEEPAKKVKQAIIRVLRCLSLERPCISLQHPWS